MARGQVETQVGMIRRRLVVLEARLRRDVPLPKFKSYAELSARLLDRCVAWADFPIPSRSTWR
jgi:hypothetical protein